MEKFEWAVDSFVGLDESMDPRLLPDGVLADLQNWYVLDGKLRRRGGTSFVTTDPYSGGRLTALFPFIDTAGNVTLLCGYAGGFVRFAGTTFVALTLGSVTGLATDTRQWSIRQYGNQAFAARKNAGRLKRLTANFFTDAGVETPTAAPTLADGATGDIVAGDYQGVVVFKNDQADRGNPSPASAVLTAAGSKKIDWSALPIPTDPQVTSKELYRTTINRAGEYFFVDEIAPGATTYTGDNFTTDELGDAASTENGLPPNPSELVEVFNEHLFVSDGRDVYFSGLGKPQAFELENDVIRVNPDDGHRISALHNDIARIVIAKTNALYYVTGTGRATFRVFTLTRQTGCDSPFSIKTVEAGGTRILIWFGGGKFWHAIGDSVAPLQEEQIRTTLAAIPRDQWEFISAEVIPEKNWYVATLGYTSGTQTLVLVFDYKEGRWFKFVVANQQTSIYPTALATIYQRDGEPYLYTPGTDGHIYRLFVPGRNLDGASGVINCFLQTPVIGKDGWAHRVTRLRVFTPATSGFLAAIPYRNQTAVAVQELNVGAYLNKVTPIGGGAPTLHSRWHNLNVVGHTSSVATTSSAGTDLQFRIQTLNNVEADEIAIQALRLEGISVARRDRTTRRPL